MAESRFQMSGVVIMDFLTDRRFVFAAVLIVASARAVSAGDVPAELLGTWKLVSVEVDGEAAAQLERAPRLVIKGDTATHGGEKFATVAADVSASPKVIDLRCSDPDRTYEGIYAIDGDTLKICLNAMTDGAKER